MASKWLNDLKEEESIHNTAAALRERQNRHPVGPAEKLKTPINPPSETSKTPDRHDVEGENLRTRRLAPSETSKTTREEKVRAFKESLRKATTKTAKTTEPPSEAELLGLVSTWSVEFGYLSLHDPTSGEWHDLQTKEAPDWVVREARKRKELYRDGDRKAFRLTSREIGKILEAERPPEEEGIVEDHPVEEE